MLLTKHYLALRGQIVAKYGTMSKFVDVVGISVSGFSSKINGKALFSGEEKSRICEALGVNSKRGEDALFYAEECAYRAQIKHYKSVTRSAQSAISASEYRTMTIGGRIRSRRKEIRMTQMELAESVGVTKETICRYESNEIVGIPPERVIAICKALGFSPNNLYGWDEPSNT